MNYASELLNQPEVAKSINYDNFYFSIASMKIFLLSCIILPLTNQICPTAHISIIILLIIEELEIALFGLWSSKWVLFCFSKLNFRPVPNMSICFSTCPVDWHKLTTMENTVTTASEVLLGSCVDLFKKGLITTGLELVAGLGPCQECSRYTLEVVLLCMFFSIQSVK